MIDQFYQNTEGTYNQIPQMYASASPKLGDERGEAMLPSGKVKKS